MRSSTWWMTCYAAFVIDSDGHPIEAVCQQKGT
jgi:hypothetical protein